MKLTLPQQDIYFEQLLYPNEPIYNIGAKIRIEGAINIEGFKDAYQSLIAQHDAYRTFFLKHEEDIIASISEDYSTELELMDFSNHKNPDKTANEFMQKEFIQAFDILSGSFLHQFILIKVSNDLHYLFSVYHHIITDGWGSSLMFQRLVKNYNEIIEFGKITSTYPFSYKDFVTDDKAYQESESYDDDKTYWVEKFKSLPENLFEKIDPTNRHNRSSRKSFFIKRETYNKLNELAKKYQSSTFHLILALLYLYFGRKHQNRDFAIGLPILNRGKSIFKKTVGLFTGVSPLRIQLNFDHTFQNLVTTIKTQLRQDYRYQRFPLGKLIQELQVFQEKEKLFNITLSYQKQNYANNFGDTKTTVIPLTHQSERVALAIAIREFDENEDVKIDFDYNLNYFNEGAIFLVAQHFQKLINELIKHPNKKLFDLNYLTEDEKQELLYTFNNTKADYPKDKTIIDLFVEQVKRTPSNIAVVFENTELTYRELDALSNQLANYLLTIDDIEVEDLIGVQLERNEWLIISLLAVMKAGAAYVPIDPNYPEQRIAYIKEDSQCKLVIDDTLLDQFKKKEDNVSTLPKVDLEPNNLAYIIYTSGTTGNPKGVMIEHKNVVRLFFTDIFLFDFNSKDVWVLFHSFCFDFSVWEIFGALLYGGKLVVIPKQTTQYPHRFCHLLEKERVTVLNQTPTAFKNLMDVDDLYHKTLKIRYVIFGGEALYPKQLERWFNKYPTVKLINMYGVTETTVHNTYKEIGISEILTGLSNIGNPISTLSCYIVDENLKLISIGVIGELCIGGAGLARGYLHREELTKEKFIAHPFKEGERLYRTGDLARWLPDGNIEFIGRKDTQIKLRGYRIELGEIEQSILKFEGVKQAVAEVKNIDEDKAIAAYIVSEVEIDKQSLRSFIGQSLPEYMIPSYFVDLDTIPLTENGKIDRKALPEVDDTAIIKKEYIAPRNEIEEQLAQIWQEVLGIEKIGVLDSFFELGGHSLKAIQLINRIKKSLNYELNVKDILISPTISEITHQLQKTSYAPIPKAPKAENYPITSSQRRLWVLSQFEGGNRAYNIPGVFELKGNLDNEKFLQSFQILIERHESLRTSFKEDAQGAIRQYITPYTDIEFTLEVIDLTSELERSEKENKLIEIFYQEEFDLTIAPLLKAKLIRVDQDRHLLLFAIHHTIGDGWSMELLTKELMYAYNSLLKGQDIILPNLPIQYKDYAVWKQNEEEQAKLEIQESYWLDKFSGELPKLELPSFKPRPSVKTYNGTTVLHHFSKDFTEELQQFSEREGVTLFMSLVAGINGLFYRYTGNRDIILGTPIAGREHPDLENQVGLYLNTLAIRTQFSKNISFKDLLFIQKETLLEGYLHQNYPFDDFVDKLNLTRNTSRSALFDVMVVFQNQQSLSLNNELGLEGLEILPYDKTSRKVSQFDMTFSFSESLEGLGLQLQLEYNTDIYDKESIGSLIKHLENFLSRAISNPKQEIDYIDYLSKEEKQELLYTFNDTKVDYPKDKTIVDLFVEQAKRTPSNIAVVFENTELTYQELDVLSNQLANYLLTIGDIEVKDLIGVQLERSEWLIISLLAVMKTGAAYVPIDPNYPEQRIAYIKEDSNCKLVIDDTLLDQFKKKEDNVSTLPKVDLEPNNLAYVIYTSGSTGSPKGVLNSHSGLHNRLLWMKDDLKIDTEDVILQKTPYTFDVSVWELIIPAITGCKLVFAKPEGHKDPVYLQKLIAIEKITIMHFVPSMLSAFLEELDVEKCKSLKHVICSGEELPSVSVEIFKHKLPWASIHNLYGPTEVAIDVTSIDLTTVNTSLVGVTIGKPVANTRIYIVDEHLSQQPIGVHGELLIEGIQVAKGYLNRPELNTDKFIDSPFHTGERLYRTGDLARWLPDGNIEFIGRKDTQIKLRGYRIELGEIEQSILKFKGIKQAVAEVKNVEKDKAIVAYIVSEEEIDKQSLREFIAQSLPEYMIPSYFVDLDNIPLTENGKIDRKALPEVKEQYIIREEYIAPQSIEEQALVDVLEDVLKHSPIGIKDNFYNLGGDSIKSIQVVSRLKQKGHSLKIEHILRTPIVEDLAKYIVANTRVVDQSFVQGTVYLSPIQHYFFSGGLKITELHHFNQFVVLKSKEELNTEILKLSIADLATHHDALRMVYKKREPIWEQYNQDTTLPCYSIDFYDLQTEENELEVMAQLGGKLQSSIDLEKGPLFKVGHFRLSDGDRLALIIHHLVVDGVSWRILLEDLSALYTHYKTGESFTLPLKTNSFQHWSSAQNQYAQGSQLASEISYWENVCNQIILEIPKDISLHTEEIEPYNSISFTLDKATTELLQTKVHSVYNTEINDLLLTALGMAMHDVFGVEKNMVQMEGHGREEIIEDIDISRTVGWFTSVYPFVLGVKSSNNLAENLVRVKEDLRKVPNKGIGYGMLKYLRSVPLSEIKPSIVFNYLGDFGTKAGNSEASIFNYSSEYIGQDSSAKNVGNGLLDITGMMVLDELSMSIRYSESAYTLETIEQLLATYQKHLTILIEDLSVEKKKHITPSDLTFKKLTIPELSTINVDGGVEDVYQLSPLQQGIYYHWLSNRSTTMYFEQISYRLRGLDLDIQSVKEAYEGLIARHSILRTSFTNDHAGTPLQVVWREAESHFKYIATPQELNSEELESYLEEIKLKDREEGFNLEEPSQMRLLILDLGNNSYELIWGFHHILMDGWCMSILLNEFNQLLNTRERNLSKPIPYSNYIQWLDTIDQETSLRYWKDYLSNYTTIAEIPFKIVKDSPSEKYIACEEILKIEGDVYAQMDKLCTEIGITHNTLIQGVWGYLLSRYNNSQDVVFGSVVSGRPAELPDIENMIGLFINTIPVRVQYRKEDTPIDLLKAFQDQSVSSISHHYSNLSEVQSQSELGMSLINHIVVFENYPIQEAIKETTKKQKDQELTIESVGVVEQTNYDFGILIVLSDSSLTVRFNYNGSVYDKRLILYLKNHFNSLIEQFSVYPNQALYKFNYLTEEEKQELLYTFNDTKVDYPKDKTVIDLFVEQAKRTPNNLAVVFKNTELTYQELDVLSNQLANYLLTIDDIEVEDLIGVQLERSEWLIISLLAVMKAGAAYVPIDPNYPEQRIAYIKEDSNCKLVIDDTLLYQFKKKEDNVSILPKVDLGPNNLAYVIYTSGSTGSPKGVMIEHKSIVNTVLSEINYGLFDEKDYCLQFASQSFDTSLSEILGALLCGSRLYIISEIVKKDVNRITEFLTIHKISNATFPPAYVKLLDVSKFEFLITLITGGEQAPFEEAHLFSKNGGRYYNAYGPTETSISASIYTGESINNIPIGKPIHNTEIYILSEDLKLQPKGVIGELCVSGVGLSRGYLNRLELTKEKFIAHPFKEGERLYRTGDLARWLPDGNIEFLGRKDHQVKLRGYRIELGEIEQSILKFEGVKQIVAEVKNTGEDKAIVAYIVSEEEINKQSLREFISQSLPEYMIPSYFVDLDTIPLTENGKVDRKALPEVDDTAIIKNEYVAPRNEIEEQLAQIWQEVLGIEKIGVLDSFFELGGHSLKAIQLINRIKKSLNYELNVKDILISPTISEITHQLQKTSYAPIPKAPKAENYPITSSQRRLWVLSQFEGGNRAYNIPGVFELKGNLDNEKFLQSFQILIERHESLRTSFKEDAQGAIRQYITPYTDIEFTLEVIDLTSELERSEKENKLIEIFYQEEFDLTIAPLLKAKLIRVDQDRHLLLFAIHHTIGDGWSMELLTKELMYAYNSLLKGQDIILPNLPIQYKDYAVWKQNEEEQAKLEIQESYWLDKFSGELPKLELPSFKPRPSVKTYNGTTVLHHFSKDFTEELQQFSEREGVTLFMSLVAGINGLFYRYTGNRDIILGTPIAGREHPDLENQVGLYLNTLAIRTQFSKNISFKDLLFIQKETLLEGYSHQNYPFDDLVDKLNLTRDTSHSALFDVMVVFQNQQSLSLNNELGLEGLEILPYDKTSRKVSQFDMTFSFSESLEGLGLQLEYNTDIYDKETIDRLIKYLESFLLKAISNPKQKLDHIDYLSKEEKQELLYTFNDTKVDYPKDKTIVDLFVEQAKRTPNNLAVVFENTELTYQELDVLSNQLANYLLTIDDIEVEDLIGVQLERSEWLMISLLAVMKTGAAYVPIDPNYPEQRIAYIKEDSNCKLVIDDTLLDQFKKKEDNVSTLPKVDLSPNNLAYVIYTSGSTGSPKGVMIEHKSVVRLVKPCVFFPLNKKDTLLSTGSISFDATTLEYYGTLLNGSKLVLVSQENLLYVKKLKNKINSCGVNSLWMTASWFKRVVEVDINIFENIKQLAVGGDVVSLIHIRKVYNLYPKLRIINGYGPTENTTFSTTYEIQNQHYQRSIPIGKPIHNTKVYILSEDLTLQPKGVIGELCVSGVGLSRGYLHREELTKEKFIAHPFKEGERIYLTGDLARWLPDRNIEFIGRKDTQIKLRGYRIELGEIEQSILKFEGVKQVVAEVKNVEKDKSIAAYIVSKKEEIDKQSLRGFIAQSLPEYMIPSYFVDLDTIPLTENGKIDRKALPEVEEQDIIREEYIAPQSAEEQALVDVLEDVLKRSPIGIKDNFYNLGGDSIKSIQVVSRLKQKGYSLKIEHILRTPIVEDLAKHIITHTKVIDQTVVEGTVHLSPIQHYFFSGGLKITELHHFNQSVVLKSKEELNTEILKLSIADLVTHHDALRMVYKKRESIWEQYNQDTALPCYSIDFYDLQTEENELEVMAQLGGKLQSSIDLEKGPLFKVGHFRLSDGDRLALIIHHLVVDGVSWRILLEDLSALYTHYKTGELFALPLKTNSFQHWSSAQNQYAQGSQLASEISYWENVCNQIIQEIPKDISLHTEDIESYNSISFTLDKATTELLQTKVHSVYNTEINDLLLTALGMAMHDVFGVEKNMVQMEGHGREEIIEDIDISRTVGWFTSVYPFVLGVKSGNNLTENLVRIKEDLRKVPNKGIGYGILKYLRSVPLSEIKPSIVFNYLGDFGTKAGNSEASIFNYSSEYIGQDSSAKNVGDGLLDITGMMVLDELSMSIRYSESAYTLETIEQLLATYQKHLTILIEDLSVEKKKHITPSDLTFKKLTIPELSTINVDGGVEDVYQLSPLQQGIYYHWLSNRSTTMYFEQISYRLRGLDLDIQSVKEAYEGLIARHSILRTSFTNDHAGMPLQVVWREAESHFKYIVTPQELNSEELESHVEEIKLKDREEGFNLEEPSQMRLLILDLGNNSYELIWGFHHILMDGWCMSILLNEFNQLLNTRDISLSKPIPYSNYIQWLDTIDQESSLRYWKDYLSNYTTVAEIPFKIVNDSKSEKYIACEEILKIEGDVYARMDKLCTEISITHNTLIQGVWGYLLSRYNNSQDVVFGSVVSGRPAELPDIENMIGLFINTIPVRVQYRKEDTPMELLKALQDQSISSMSHHYSNLSEVQSQSELGMSLINHIVVFENYPIQEAIKESTKKQKDQGLTIESVGIVEQTNYDFGILIILSDSSLTVRFNYNGSVYDKQSIAYLKNHFNSLIEQFSVYPNQALHTLNYLTEEEKHKLLYTFNDTKVDYPKDKTVIDLFVEQVKRRPDNIAVVFENTELTYQELDALSNQLANYLLTIDDIEVEDLIGVQLERSEWLIISLLAVMKTGAAYVPIDPNYPEQRIAYIKEDTSCKLVIDDTLLDQFKEEDIVSTLPKVDLSPNNLAYVIYTSGSTGSPKGVMIEHKSVVRLVKPCVFFPLNKKDTLLSTGSISFDATTLEYYGTLLNGSKLVLVSQENLLDVKKLKNKINSCGVNSLWMTASWFKRVVEVDINIFENIKQLAVGGDVVSLIHIRKVYNLYPKLRIINGYGPTENTTFSTTYEIQNQHYQRSIPIGKPIHNTEIHILSEDLTLQPKGVIGELCISGVGLSRGYLHREELTKEKFIAHPFKEGERLYRTGDLARWLPDGNIEFIGRKDTQIKLRGYRIELGEIEQSILKFEGVKQAVAEVKNIGEDKAIVAYIVSKKEEIDKQSLREFIAQSLPEYMIPSYFGDLDTIPLTENGKIDRKALPEVDDTAIIKKEYVAPRNEIEKQLAQIWQEVLGIEKIGVLDNFFELGGHSIKAIQVISQINCLIEDSNLTLGHILAHPTIKKLTSFIKKRNYNLINNNGIVKFNSVLNHEKNILILPGGEGILDGYFELIEYLLPNANVYGINYLEIYNTYSSINSIESLSHKISTLLNNHKIINDNLHIIGHSFGGIIGFEIVKLLEQKLNYKLFLTILDATPNLNEKKNIYQPKINNNIKDILTLPHITLLHINKLKIFQKFNEECIQWVRKYEMKGKISTSMKMIEAEESFFNIESIKKWEAFTSKITYYKSSGSHSYMVKNENIKSLLKIINN